MKPLGIILIIISTLLPLYWYIPLAGKHDSLAVFSQYLGSASLILMGIVQFLATRAYGLEVVFGGMDRIYVLHKWMAVIAILFAAIHDTVDADMDGLGAETFLTDLAETMGEIGFYGLLVLGIVTVITFVPYHYWKWSHRFIGFFFALSAFHYVFILKPFDNFDPLGFYVLAFCILGVLSYLYLLLPKHWTSQTTDYTVTAVHHAADATEIKLSPKSRGIKHQAGQFSFVSFDLPEHKEPHPFTISSSPEDNGELRFTVKNLGDYTATLGQSIQEGTTAKLSRAYGHFRMGGTDVPQVWIAAGIGITPFIAWAQTLDAAQAASIKLYYCVTSRDKALYYDELEAIAKAIPKFEVTLVESGVDARLSADRIKQESTNDVSALSAYFCGPKAMRESLKSKLESLGLKRGAFHYEEFEIRSGIGVRKFVNWLLARYGDKVLTKKTAK